MDVRRSSGQVPRLRVVMLAFLLGLFGSFQLSFAKDRKDEPQTLDDASSNNFPPINVLGKDGNLTGFGCDLADAVMKAVGHQVIHIHSPYWVQVLEWLESGKADFIHDTGYTKDRDEFLDYSDPILEMPEVIFVRPDQYDVTDIDSLKGKTVACVKKHISHLYLQKFPEIKLHVVRTPVEALYELVAGKVDAFIYPKQIVIYLAQNLRLGDKIKIAGKPLRTLTWSMVVKEGNKKVLGILNQGISRVRESGEYDRIYEKWWGKKILAGYSKRELYVITAVTTGGSLLIALTIILLLFNRKLSKGKKELKAEIVERKQADEALRESEEKYRNVFNNAQVGIFRTRISDGKVLECNDRFARTYGYRTPEECINDFVVSEHYTDPGAREKMMASLMEKGEVNDIEACFSRKDGEEAWIRFSARAYPEGGYLEGVGYDITEEKRALEALQQGEEKYRQLSDSLPQIVFETNEKDNLTFTNRMAFDILGYTKEDFEKGLNALQMLIPEDHDRALKNIQRVLKGEKLGGTEYTALTKDGRRYPAMVYSTPIISEGKSVGMRGIVTDLTEVKRTQKALLESEEKLARSNKMEAMGLMAGGVAHDLNNILSGIVSYPELLLLDLPEDSPLRNPIKTIQESGMRAADVVEDLLTIARGVATGNEVLNLNTIVEEYINSAEHQKLEKTHPLSTFKTDLDSELLNITGSASHVKKILMNLTVNASEAIEGSGTVTISTTNQYLDEPLKGYEDVRIGEYVLLSISDDGSGISPQDLDKIFEPFYTKKVMGRSGTGLGLAVVWNSMQDHNGYINVRSSEKGTVFELYFPTTREQVADEGEQVRLDDYLGHGEKILVVDDEERQREIAGEILTRLGYTAEVVSSGEEAIEYVKENPVDLIVLDMVMPKGINGRKTYEEIIKIHPGQKAVIASGYTKTKEVDLAQELGAGKYIKKPYTLAKVGVAVKEELEK